MSYHHHNQGTFSGYTEGLHLKNENTNSNEFTSSFNSPSKAHTENRNQNRNVISHFSQNYTLKRSKSTSVTQQQYNSIKQNNNSHNPHHHHHPQHISKALQNGEQNENVVESNRSNKLEGASKSHAHKNQVQFKFSFGPAKDFSNSTTTNGLLVKTNLKPTLASGPSKRTSDSKSNRAAAAGGISNNGDEHVEPRHFMKSREDPNNNSMIIVKLSASAIDSGREQTHSFNRFNEAATRAANNNINNTNSGKNTEARRSKEFLGSGIGQNRTNDLGLTHRRALASSQDNGIESSSSRGKMLANYMIKAQ
jgi:hypothetical protein